MTTANEGGPGTATPVAPDTVSLELPGAKPTPAPAPAPEDKGEPKWLPERLERERAKVLKDAGVSSFDELKAFAASAKEAAEAKKSDAEKAATARAELEKAQATIATLSKTASEAAAATLAALTEEQRAAVIEAAGEDPAAQIRTVNAFKKTWAASAAPVVVASTPAPPPNTMPSKGTPNDNGTAGSAPDPRAIYAELLKTNPYFAPRYAAQHGIHTSA